MNIVGIAGGSPVAAFVPVVVALMALVGICIATWAGFRVQRTTRLVENVTAERARWRADVRVEAASLSAAVVRGLAREKVDRDAFTKARVGLLLRVNPQGRLSPQPPIGGHRLDLTVMQRLDALALAVEGASGLLAIGHVRDCVRRDLRLLEFAVQELLKQEWEASKLEAWKGRIKRPAEV